MSSPNLRAACPSVAGYWLGLFRPQTLTVGQRVAYGFCTLLALIIGIGLLTLTQLRKVDSAAVQIVDDCLPGIFTISQMQSCVKENRALIQHHVLSDGEGLKQKLANLIHTNLQQLVVLTRDYEKSLTTPRGRELYSELQKRRAPFDSSFEQVLRDSSQGESQKAMERLMQDLVPQCEAYLEALENQVRFNHDTGDLASERISSAVRSTRKATWIGLGLTTTLALVIGLFLVIRIHEALARASRSLVAGTEQVTSTAEGLTQGSRELAEAAARQSSSLEKTSAAVLDAASMAERNAGNARAAAQLAVETRQAAESSRQGVTEMQRATEGIRRFSGELQTSMNEIRSSSAGIAKIVKTINEIAFQTNLLALNAAVEAARAGEAGASFGVVAEEVRRLAQRCSVAAEETASLVQDTLQKSAAGIAVAENVSEALTEIDSKTQNTSKGLLGILDRAQQVDEHVASISQASHEQSMRLQQITQAVHEMEEVATSNTKSAADALQNAQQLSEQSASLDTALASLLVLTGRQGSVHPATDNPNLRAA